MKKLITIALLFLVSHSLYAQTSPSVISYQGLLRSSSPGSQIAGNRLLTVTLYGDAEGTVKLWQSTMNTLIDSSGVFNCLLGTPDNPLPNSTAMDRPMWIGIAVDHNAEMRPLSQLTSSPYALNVADSSITSSKMKMNYVSSISVNGQPITGRGTNLNIVAGDGLNATWVPDLSTLTLSGGSAGGGATTLAHNGTSDYWGQTGNNSTHTDTNYLGTSDSTAFEIHVNNNSTNTTFGNRRVMRYEATGSSPNLIGGWHGNYLGTPVEGAVIAGGGDSIGGPNAVLINNGTIGGGVNNTVNGQFGTISGGINNSISGLEATVGGGYGNSAGNSVDHESEHQTVGGGYLNIAFGDDAVVAGGEDNQAIGGHSNVAGGYTNYAGKPGSSVGGGENNTASGGHASVVGGEGNTASGDSSVVLGGGNNYSTGIVSAVLGGCNLELSDHSLGFNGSTSSALVDMLVHSHTNVGYFGNIDLWIGNINDTARQLRFYAPNTDQNYGSASYYSAFHADTQSANIIYTLPSTIASVGQFLTAATVSGTDVTLSWATDTSGGGSAGWLLTGNAGTSAPTNYLGTQDNEAFEIHIHNNTLDTTGGNQRVMRYSEGSTSPNILGGSSADSIESGLSGAAILSGGSVLAPNMVTDTFSVVVGGRGNVIQGPFCTIAGGENDTIYMTGADHNTIGGGFDNVEQNPSYGVIAGGAFNLLDNGAWSSTIGGGYQNTVRSPLCFLGSGQDDTINTPGYGFNSVLVGGRRNFLDFSSGGFLGGGYYNELYGNYSVLGGGYADSLNGQYAVLVGGDSNKTIGDKTFLGGGCYNTVSQKWGIIVGGCGNAVTDTLGFVGGGNDNIVASTLGAIGGGAENLIAVSGTEGECYAGFIGGGQQNQITDADMGTFYALPPYRMPQFAAITGGVDNRAEGQYSAIGSGRDNLALGIYATIPGGIGLIAQDYQTVIGRYNLWQGFGQLENSASINKLPFGNNPGGDTAEILATSPDYQLFIIGNGSINSAHVTAPSDAFTVANAGYSTAYDNIGAGAPTHMGSTYENNTTIAWGTVLADTLAANIGVQVITYDTVSREYTIKLNVFDAGSSTPHTFTANNSAVVATLINSLSGTPGIIEASPVVTTGPSSTFTVRTWPAGSTIPTNTFGFMFYVVGK